MTRHEDEDDEPRRLGAWRCWGWDACGADDCTRCHPLGEGAWVSDETTNETEVDDE